MISQSPVWFGNEKIWGEKEKEEKSKMDIFIQKERYRERERENYVHDIGGVK